MVDSPGVQTQKRVAAALAAQAAAAQAAEAAQRLAERNARQDAAARNANTAARNFRK